MMFKTLLILFLIFVISLSPSMADSLSYSGRLVNHDGSPVTGNVNLKFELAYTDDLNVILCSQQLTNVSLNHGVFHAKLTPTCPSSSLLKVLEKIPPFNSIAVRVTDESANKQYPFQALHSVPLAIQSETSKQLVQMNAKKDQILSWNGEKWVPVDPTVSSGGTITSITVGDGLYGGTITESGVIGIQDGGVTSEKLAPMGASAAGQVLKWNGSFWWADNDSGLVTESDPTVKNFAKMDLPMCASDEYYTHDAMVGFLCTKIDSNHLIEGTNNLFFTDSRAQAAAVEDAMNDNVTDKAPSQNVVFDKLALKQDKIESSLKLTSGSNSVTLEAPTTGGDISYVLPVMGSSGQVLKLGPSNTLVWGDTGVSGSDIASNSITNSHVADGALSQSKISGLTTDLSAIDTRITNLNTDNIPEGSTNKYFTNEKVFQAPLLDLRLQLVLLLRWILFWSL